MTKIFIIIIIQIRLLGQGCAYKVFLNPKDYSYIVGNSMLHLSLHSYVDSVVVIIESRYRKEMAPRGCHYLTQI